MAENILPDRPAAPFGSVPQPTGTLPPIMPTSAPGATAGTLAAPGQTPQLQGSNPAVNQLLAGLMQLMAGQGGAEGGQFNIGSRTSQVEIPGFGPTSISTVLYEPYRLKRAQVIALQRNLAAAGYLNAKKVKIPGWYGEETLQAYATLIEESVRAGVQPSEVLKARALSAQGKDPGVLGGDMGEDEHRKMLEERYIKSWAQRPPPGYLERFKDLNADEFEWLEQQKDSWIDKSPMAQEQKDQMFRELSDFLGMPGPVSGQVG